MKKRPKKRVQTASKPLSSATQIWIIFLLSALVVLTALDLYMDHYHSFTPMSSEPLELKEEVSHVTEAIPTTTEQESEPEPVQQQEEEKPQDTPTRSVPPEPSVIKVEVLNGCGVRGIAARVRGILRDRGFDVMRFGNAPNSNYSESQIIVRTEGEFGGQAARILARSVGVDTNRILIEIDPSLVEIDVTLIIGRDHRELNL